MQKYADLALERGMVHAKLISPEDLVLDIRTFLKCRWGCEYQGESQFKCQERGTRFEDRQKMLNAYETILLLHCHNGRDVGKAALEIERRAFLDGHHLAFAIRQCNICKACAVDEGKACVKPLNVRPCEAIFGIDVYETARKNDLPCYPLKDKDETQNRYAFVCLR